MEFLQPRQTILPDLLQNIYAERILADFDWREYLRIYPDVAENCLNEHSAKHHFLYNGYNEKRLVFEKRTTVLDPTFYRGRYPQLCLDSDADAQFHYSYSGYYENRFPNADSEWIFDCDLHIFQMGKVGSHSLATGLEHKYQGGILHLHWLTDIAISYPQCLIPYSKILLHDRPRRVRVISATREVVSRVLSGIFQFLDDGCAVLTADQVNEFATKKFLAYSRAISTWFDHKYFCDLDVYKESTFDHSRGYIRIQHPKIDLLIYRQENLSALGSVIGEFAGAPNFVLEKKNIADDKRYSVSYEELFNDFTVPREILQQLYATPYMQFFYSDEERARYLSFWSAKRK